MLINSMDLTFQNPTSNRKPVLPLGDCTKRFQLIFFSLNLNMMDLFITENDDNAFLIIASGLHKICVYVTEKYFQFYILLSEA